MYKEYFNLTRQPFTREIEVDKLFLTQGHREAISRMTYAVTNRMLMLFTGEYGLGKSTVLRCLKYKLESSKYEVLYLNQSKATARSFYSDILTQLRLEPPYQLPKARLLTHKALLGK